MNYCGNKSLSFLLSYIRRNKTIGVILWVGPCRPKTHYRWNRLYFIELPRGAINAGLIIFNILARKILNFSLHYKILWDYYVYCKDDRAIVDD